MQPVRETEASPDWVDSNHIRGSPWRCAPALRNPCFAWVPARAILARAFAGVTPALRSPAPLGHRPKPSVAWAFGGAKVHWTFALFRLTHWTVTFIWLTLLRAKGQGAHPCAPARSGDPGVAHSVLRLRTGPSLPWLGRSPGQGFTGPLAYLRLTRWTFVPSSPTRSHHLSQRYCRQRC
jgi:hypothetical protein